MIGSPETWLTLSRIKDLAAIIAPALAPFVAVWLWRRQHRELFYAGITFGPIAYDQPAVLVVFNRTTSPLMIMDIRYRGGLFRRILDRVALDYDDPDDLDFPFRIEPGATRNFKLNEELAKQQIASYSRLTHLLALLRRSRLVVEVVSIAGFKTRVSAEKLLPWDERLWWAR